MKFGELEAVEGEAEAAQDEEDSEKTDTVLLAAAAAAAVAVEADELARCESCLGEDEALDDVGDNM